ncbi:MAG: putative iron-regulated membrane protein [Candidatus Krumholzibacteriia bacterium]|jgi:uncharacterized iron-regulated membrane protein
MTRGQKRSIVRRAHAGLGWAAALILVVLAATGIWLQHSSWLGEQANNALSIAVDPTDPQRMLRGTHWGVEASEDGGRNWQEIAMLAPPTNVSRIVFVAAVTGDNEVYAMGDAAIVMSNDGGRVWSEVLRPTDEQAGTAKFLDLSVSSTGELMLLTTTAQFQKSATGAWALVGELAKNKRSLEELVHNIHTGHVFGKLGRGVAEGGAWALIILTFTGLILHRRAGSTHQGNRS